MKNQIIGNDGNVYELDVRGGKPSEEKECKFCGEKHIDWEKEYKYWGKPPVKITGDLESIPNSTALEWEEKFDSEFPYDTLVSAHQDWTYDAVKKFISRELQSQKKELLEEISEMRKKALKYPMVMPERSIKCEDSLNEGYDLALKNVIDKLSKLNSTHQSKGEGK